MNWLKIAAINLAVGVGLGAFGAHGLKKIATGYQIEIWQTATLYLFVHALGLLAIGVLQLLRYRTQKAALFMQAGILIFSGSLYSMALGAPKWLGAITPIGGTCFIIAWILLACIQIKPSQPIINQDDRDQSNVSQSNANQNQTGR